MTARKSESQQAQDDADRVEDKPTNPMDIFETDTMVASDEEQEEQAKADLEEDLEQLEVDAVDFGEFGEAEVVEDEEDSKSDKKKKQDEDAEDEEEGEDEEGDEDAGEDEEDEEDEDEEQEEEEDEEKPEEEGQFVKALKEQQEAFDATIAEMQKKFDASLAAQSKSESEEEDEEENLDPVFNIGVPDEFVTGMLSGEPAEVKKALTLFANGVAEVTRRHVLKEGREALEARFEAERTNLTKMGAVQKEQQDITKDFYGTYPKFNTPELHKIVGVCAKDYFDSTPGAVWGPTARDAIADGVSKIVKFNGKADSAKANRNRGRKTSKSTPDGKKKGKAKVKPKKSAGSRPPRQVKAGTRVAEALNKRKDRQEDISDTFADFRR